MKVLIGSAALQKYEVSRSINDIDLLMTYDDYLKFSKSLKNKLSEFPINNAKKMLIRTSQDIFEIEIAWPDSSAEKLLNFILKDPKTRYKNNTALPSLNILYLLKMSHRFLRNSPHFLKTRNDILLMRKLGASITEDILPLFLEREKETYNYSHPSLNKTKEDFFKDDDVPYKYDHDSLHESMKQLDKPAYLYFKSNDKEVLTNKELFFSIDEKIQLYSVLEESFVLALERSQIPFPGILTPKKSFNIALVKICSSISSGFWREFAWENYDKVKELYSDNYVEKFYQALKNGVIKEFKETI